MKPDDIIIYALTGYGHLIERNTTINSIEFAEKIKSVYSMDEKRNRVMVDILTNNNYLFKKGYDLSMKIYRP